MESGIPVIMAMTDKVNNDPILTDPVFQALLNPLKLDTTADNFQQGRCLQTRCLTVQTLKMNPQQMMTSFRHTHQTTIPATKQTQMTWYN